MRRRLGTIAEGILTPVLAVCALVTPTLTIRRELSSRRQEITLPNAPILGRPVIAKPRSDGRLLIGSPNARVRLLEYADFQCPFCSKAAQVVRKTMTKNPDALALEFHHLPIPGHKFARSAAHAAECAADQNRFAEFYYLVFDNQGHLGDWSWSEFARRSGVPDAAAFARCMRDERYASRIDKDIEAAHVLGIRGTPSWQVGDSLYGGLPPESQIEGWLRLR